MITRAFAAGVPHGGADYLEVMREVATRLRPRSYLEIGTCGGESLRQVACDALCIDPGFAVAQNVLLRRTRSFFFQMPSDDFFRDHAVETFLPQGLDLAFLDGLHHFEATLRDFINVERAAHRRTVVLVHDCLPPHLDMTSRVPRAVMWTGDVWRLLPIFKKYRPDLRVAALDCEPTGLVVCTGLDPASTTLTANYHAILDEFANAPLDLERLQEIGDLFPYLDSREMLAHPEMIPAIFG